MDLKDMIRTEVKLKPPRILLHGVHGVGKTTFGASAPHPIIIQTEDGLAGLSVPHFDLASDLDTVFSQMTALIKQDHEYKTLVVDTIDWLEKLIWDKIVSDHKTNISDISEIGYGKGYAMALQYWSRFVNGLDKIRDKGMVVLLLAHNEVKHFDPPDGDGYDRYQVKLHKAASAKIEEWADCVLFANYKVYVTESNGKSKGTGAGERVLYTSERPAWKAKNRYNLPLEMPMDMDNLLKTIKGETK